MTKYDISNAHRTEVVYVRVSAGEKRTIEAAAAAEGQSVVAWCRALLLAVARDDGEACEGRAVDKQF